MKKALLQMMTCKTMDRLMTKIVGPSVTIYTLHRPTSADNSFSGIDEQLLEQCLQYAVARDYAFASIDEVVKAAMSGQALTRPTLCFTLDDGYADQVERLVPVLLKYQAKPTLFTITDFVDQQDWPWDAKLAYLIWQTPKSELTIKSRGEVLTVDCSTPNARVQTRRTLSRYAKTLSYTGLIDFLTTLAHECELIIPAQAPAPYTATTWQELRRYTAQGLHVGAHTRSHYVLSSLKDEQALLELNHSRARIHAEIVHPSQVFCYPSGTAGDFSPTRDTKLVEQVGFTAAVTTISKPTDYAAIRAQPFLIDRIGFPETLERFIRYSSWIEVLRSRLS